MTHTELCLATAKHFLKDAIVALYEYQSYATREFPGGDGRAGTRAGLW